MSELIVAAATPRGPGALAVVRLGGAGARAAAQSFLKARELEPRRATLAVCEGVDELVATWFPAETSPTGEDLVELSCHGSPCIVEKLIAAALKAGARAALPGEFTQRAFVNGKLDLAQAEAVCDLISARTGEAHKAALSQLQGGLSQEVARLREPILDLLIRVEASLDHPEEDIPAMPPADFQRACAKSGDEIARTAATYKRGRLIREGAKIAIVGRPNAGKSSLMNALLGRDRAIVCPEPGTTRDTLEELVDVGGTPVVLVDTAGVREVGGGGAEEKGIERTFQAVRESDLALLVIDGSENLEGEDRRALERLARSASEEGRRVVSVINKADLPARVRHLEGDPIRVSALKKTGIEALVKRISDEVKGKETESFVITRARHRDALERAEEELRLAGEESLHERWEDRSASRLREALRALDEIVGPAAPDEVLAGIFSRFCVGK